MTTAELSNPLRSADARPPLNLSPLPVAGLVFLFAFICFLPLPAGAPLAGTEGHRAVTAHQMVTSGEWVVPRMFGRIYLAKPPLHYWILATFETLSGRATPFIWRLPSALEASLTAAILSLFASRWFGALAGWVGGLSFVCLVCLWGENRGADIDVTNTLSANLAALCLLELHFRSPRRRAAWIALASLAVGASWLTKGPAGMTIILGALAAIAIDAFRNRRALSLARPSFWLAPLIGIAIFGIWALACRHFLRSHGLPLDLSGVQEGTMDTHPHNWSWRKTLEWFFFPATMFLYAMPVSIALPLTALRDVRNQNPERTRLMVPLAFTVLLAWLVCFLSGMHLPRYAYVTLPLLCPLAGAVASACFNDPHLRSVARAILFWTLLGFAIASIAVTGRLWRPHPEVRPLIIAIAVLAILIAGAAAFVLQNNRDTWKPLWALPALLLILSVAIATFAHFERLRRSSIVPAQQILQQTGPNAELVTCAMVLDQPELFYYTGLPTIATNDDKLDWRSLKSGTWVVLELQELQDWQKAIPNRLHRVLKFTANKNTGYLVWYAIDDPAHP